MAALKTNQCRRKVKRAHNHKQADKQKHRYDGVDGKAVDETVGCYVLHGVFLC